MLSMLFVAKAANVESSYIESAKSSCTKNACASNTYARAIFAWNAFSVIGACIKDASPDGIGIKGAGRESACAGVACAIKHSKIHLQSFSISEMELFDTN